MDQHQQSQEVVFTKRGAVLGFIAYIVVALIIIIALH